MNVYEKNVFLLMGTDLSKAIPLMGDRFFFKHALNRDSFLKKHTLKGDTKTTLTTIPLMGTLL